MNKTVKTKLCWNCEGVVALTAENCPYCGVSVVPASLDGSPANFSPPYRMGTSQPMAVPRSPYLLDPDAKGEESENAIQNEKTPDESLAGFKTVLCSILCLLSGSTLLIFGAVLALFAQEEVFTLSWDSSFWIFYIGFSLPLLFFGWRCINKLD